MQQVYGYCPDEVAGRLHFYDLHADSDREAFKAKAFAAFERREPFVNWEHPCRPKMAAACGSPPTACPLLRADGTLRGYRGSDTDITQSKQAQRRQRLSAEILGILNKPVDLTNAINGVLAAIKLETEFDAVGFACKTVTTSRILPKTGFPMIFC